MNSGFKVAVVGFAILAFGIAGLGCSGGPEGLDPAINPSQPVLSVPSEVAKGGLDRNAIELARFELYKVVSAEQVQLANQKPLVLHPTQEELRAIALQDKADRTVYPGPQLIGASFPVNAVVDLSGSESVARLAKPVSLPVGAIQGAADGGFVWTAVVRSEGAKAVRVRFAEMALPAGVELFVYNDLGEAYGPFVGTGPESSGDFLAPSVAGDTAFVQLRHQGAEKVDLTGARFVIAEVVHIDPAGMDLDSQGVATPKYAYGTMCYTGACIFNVNCYDTTRWSFLDTAKLGVAHIQFAKRRTYYMCSGGLLADSDPSTQIPYFLTANHCIGDQASASTLEFYFQYEASLCATTCGDPNQLGVKVPGGATLLKTSTVGDFSFMKMANPPPANSVFLGWNVTDISKTTNLLHRVSHPRGGPQAYSEHTVVVTPPTVCNSIPQGLFIYSHDSLNGTQGGSSGSPLLNDAGQVVGQEYGACGQNTSDDCATDQFSTVDGAMAKYFPNICQWIGTNCAPTCGAAGATCATNSGCCSGRCQHGSCR